MSLSLVMMRLLQWIKHRPYIKSFRLILTWVGAEVAINKGRPFDCGVGKFTGEMLFDAILIIVRNVINRSRSGT